MNQNIVKVFATRSFEAGVKQLKKQHKTAVLDELYNTVLQLINLDITKQKHNHPLKNSGGHNDIHLDGGNLILIYRYEDDVLAIGLRLQDIVDHDQLQGYPHKKYSAPAKEYDISQINSSTDAVLSYYDQFEIWYDNLDEEQQWEVDNIADSEGLPFYEDCTEEELAWLMQLGSK